MTAERAPATFSTQRQWEAWLEDHHATERELWLRLAKKGADERTLTYVEAVEGALCFGWIDGQAGPIDDRSYRQRFTPRSPRSRWSQINRDRATELIRLGRMRPDGLEEVERAKRDGRWEAAYASPRTAAVPEDLARALRANPRAARFFETLDGTNRYAILYRVDEAKRRETRARRIAGFVEMLEVGETIYPQTRRRRSEETAVDPSPMAAKLRITPGARLLLLDAPEGVRAMLDPLPDGAEVRSRAGGRAAFDVVHLFVEDRAALDRRWRAISGAVRPGGILWISYPKRSSGPGSDLNRDVLRDELAGRGWQAVSQVAIDDRWSALRFKPLPAT